MEQIIFIIFLLVVGYCLKFFDFQQNFAQGLNLFIIYITIPATVLLQVPKIHFDTTFLLPAVIPYVVLIVSILIVRIFFKNESDNTKAALYLVIPLCNTSFFGFPMLEALVGTEAIRYGVVYDLFGSFVILTLYGGFIVAYFSGDVVNRKTVTKRILVFPPFVALFVSLIIGELPSVTIPYAETLSKTLVPLAMISVGFSLQLRLAEEKVVFFKALFVKMFVLPSIVFAILYFMEFRGIIALTTLLESAMPSMITAGALAINAGFAPRLTAALVGYGILLALLSVSMFKHLFVYFT